MKIDEVGVWSEIKLEVLKEYAKAYTSILTKQNWCKGVAYIDAFAGAGKHISRRTGQFILGSPLNALEVKPPFSEFHFIDIDENRAKGFDDLSRENSNIHAYHGDCNHVLQSKIFPTLGYNSFRRALCILDPYGLTLQWKTVEQAGKAKTMDIFINFPIMDINRNVLFDDLNKASTDDINRMTAFWGDESWKELLYCQTRDLFGDEHHIKIDDYRKLAKAYADKLKQVAGFGFVPEPLLMTNTKNGPLYFLYFASNKGVAQNIINFIFDKYRTKGYN
jgi:three-Cys-motif partner protein